MEASGHSSRSKTPYIGSSDSEKTINHTTRATWCRNCKNQPHSSSAAPGRPPQANPPPPQLCFVNQPFIGSSIQLWLLACAERRKKKIYIPFEDIFGREKAPKNGGRRPPTRPQTASKPPHKPPHVPSASRDLAKAYFSSTGARKGGLHAAAKNQENEKNNRR